MKDVKQRAQDLKARIDKVRESFNLEDKKKELYLLETDSMEPGLWDDQERARKIMSNLSNLKQEIDKFEKLSDDITTLNELYKENESPDTQMAIEISKLEKSLDQFELKTYLSGVYDKKSAIVSIHAGQGGTEAMDWTSMLYRMYLRYCERMDWSTETIDMSIGEEAGYKSVTFKVDGAYSYGYLKGEAGTHRLVRQSPFNADNLRQTSFALVEVLPDLEASDVPHVLIREEDVEWQFFRSGGHGGQNVNKVSTAVRLKHIPSGITVTAQTQRQQEQNREFALNLLRAKLWIRQEEMEKQKIKDIKGDYKPASWGNQIRSYVLHPYKMVKDLRTDIETSDSEGVLDGNLDEFIEAELRIAKDK